MTDDPSQRPDQVSDEIKRLYEQVPAIGQGRRWYDWPYRLLTWLSSGARRRVFPSRFLHFCNRWVNWLIPFDEIRRERIKSLDGPLGNLNVPSDEHVKTGGVWTLELFAPSHQTQLTDALARAGWDKSRQLFGTAETNDDAVREARSGLGGAWWRVGTVTTPRSPYLHFEAQKGELIEDFGAVEIVAIQVGSGLTAVVAQFHMSDSGMNTLDDEWHAVHEPTFKFRGSRRARVEGRHFSGLRSVQTARHRQHAAARQWMADTLPGFFAKSGNHPVVDLLLFDEFRYDRDPIDRDLRDALRALGIDGGFDLVTSPELPTLSLVEPPRALDRQHLVNSWAITGCRADAAAAWADRRQYSPGSDDARFVSQRADDAIQDLLLLIGVENYCRELHRRQSEARDKASAQHKRFGRKQVSELRARLLADSLDLPTVARDAQQLWEPWWRRSRGVTLHRSPAPSFQDSHRDASTTVVEDMSQARREDFDRLIDDDREYREVLATAASLGATLETSRLGRYALAIAIISLVVAATTAFVTEVNGQPFIGYLVDLAGRRV